MTIELLEAQRQWLPQFDGKSINALGTIETPAGTVPHPVPLDPVTGQTEPGPASAGGISAPFCARDPVRAHLIAVFCSSGSALPGSTDST